MSDLDRRVAPTFAAQLSLATRCQVLAAGGNDSLIRRRVVSGRWEVAEAGVYGLAGVAWTWRRNLAAVVFAVAGALASHRAAACLLGAVHDDRATPPLELSVPASRSPAQTFDRTRARIDGLPIVIHESVDLRRISPVLIDGIRTTPPLRLAVDLGSVVPFNGYRRAVGTLRRAHGVDWASLDRVYRQHSIQGRNGCGALRDLLERHFGAAGAPDEVVEAQCADLLIAAGLPMPEHQWTVTRPDGKHARFDLAYPEYKIGIETDGKIHEEEEVVELDHVRRNAVQLIGWTVFHFTWEEVNYQPHRVVATIREALRVAGHPMAQ